MQLTCILYLNNSAFVNKRPRGNKLFTFDKFWHFLLSFKIHVRLPGKNASLAFQIPALERAEDKRSRPNGTLRARSPSTTLASPHHLHHGREEIGSWLGTVSSYRKLWKTWIPIAYDTSQSIGLGTFSIQFLSNHHHQQRSHRLCDSRENTK